nr:hypothetical protein [Tanacetum cinerariifolium]
MDQDSAHMVVASKVPMLKPGVKTTIAPATAEEKAQRSNISTNEAVNTAHGVTTISTQANTVNSSNIDNLSDVVICAFLASQPNSPQLINEDLEQIHLDDLEEMDLKWQMAMLTMRARRFLKKTDIKLTKEGIKRNVPIKTPASTSLVSYDGLGGYDWSDQAEDGPNYALMAYSSTSSNSEKEGIKRNVPIKTPASTSLVSYDGLGGYDWSDQAEDGPNYALMAYSSTSSNSEIVNKCKAGLGYNIVPPPYTGNFMPPKLNFTFPYLKEFVTELIVSEPIVKKHVVEPSKDKASAETHKVVRKNFGPLIIEDWILDSKDEAESKSKIEKKTVKSSFVKIEFVKSKEQVKSPRKTTVEQGVQNRQNTHKPEGNQRN